MTWTYPKHLNNLLPDVQRFHAQTVADTGATLHDSGNGPALKAVGTSLNARATALVAVNPTDGRANEIAWRLNQITAYKITGYPGDTGK
jgi:hypothetical protein